MITVSGDLGFTSIYTRREFAYLGGLSWPDAREGTLWLKTSTAKNRRIGNRHTRDWVSRYAIYEHDREPGFMGRIWQFDKEYGEDEHAPREGDRKPPYVVRLDHHGEIWCTCMAGACKAPSCRHSDAILRLLDEGALPEQPREM